MWFFYLLFPRLLFLAGCLSPSWEKMEEEEPEILTRPDDWDDGSEPAEEPQDGDIDGDGYGTEEDCDDWDPAVHPGAAEVWDSEDNDCDGWIDLDGAHVGEVEINATAIYEGQPYYFFEICPASSLRERGSIVVSVDCEVNLDQEMAETLLGARLMLGIEADFLDGDFWTGRMDVLSTGGPFDWDTQGEAALHWSDLEVDGGASLNMEGELDAFSLGFSVEGVLYR
jgi:hypothetical protein